MLQELADEGENHGLKMYKSKAEVVMENDTPVYVNNTQIENVESYIYLGQRYSIRKKKKTMRIKEESRTDGQHSPSIMKRQFYNSCVLPTMTYGAEIWVLTTQAKKQKSR